MWKLNLRCQLCSEDDFTLHLIQPSAGLIKNSFRLLSGRSPTPIRAQDCALLEEIDGASRRPLSLLTLMRHLLSKTTAFKGAGSRAARAVWLQQLAQLCRRSRAQVLDKTFCEESPLTFERVVMKPFTLSTHRPKDVVSDSIFALTVFVCLFVSRGERCALLLSAPCGTQCE